MLLVMKNRKRIIIMVIVAFIICVFGFCYFIFFRTERIFLSMMPVPDIQEQIDVHKELGYCMGGYVDENGTGAVIEVTKWQKKKWLDTLYEELADYLNNANEINHMKINMSSDTKQIVVYADKEVNYKTLATYLGAIVWNIEIIQVLNGEEDWSIEFVAKDIKTEEVIYQASFPEERIQINESLWDEIEK